MTSRWASTAICLFLMSVATTAHAGRTRFGWLYDNETIPERTVEIETWILEEDGEGEPDVDETLIWWGPVVGITDELEIAFPIEIEFKSTEGMSATNLDRVGAELHWRLVDADPIESGPFAPLLRLAVKRKVGDRQTARFEPGLVFGYDLGRVHAVADVGGLFEVNTDGDLHKEFRPGLGVSVRVGRELRIGAEFYGEITIGDDSDVDWLSLGPNLSWTHGRFWLAASFPVGLLNTDAAPRLNWGVAF